MDYVARRLLFAFFILLVIIGCWILVIGHQLDLGALNLAKNDSLDAVMIGAYIMTGLSAVVIGLAFLSAWLKI